ncbi:MAG: hypothetical protein E3J54_02455 [Actinobacteria bacterium]|nr:MAG: hypothetical protein E3J54_02455 [Actinomycetota bacterium]
MRVYQLAQKLGVKSKDVVEKLSLLKIEAAPNSKIDADIAQKATILIEQPLRVEEVAKKLNLSVEKLLKRLKKMNIEVISHLSLMHEAELVRLLKLKTLDQLKDKSLARKLKTSKPKLEVLKIKPKKKRVFEMADELGVSESTLLKRLRQMNVLALHRRSPLDAELVERLKAEQYSLTDRIKYRFFHFFDQLPELVESAKPFFTGTKFFTIIIVIIALLVSANLVVAQRRYLNQKLYEIQGAPVTQSKETLQVLETIALLEAKKYGLKIPIVEEGKDESPIVAVLTHKSSSVAPGIEGISILEDKQGRVSKELEVLKRNDIFYITDIEGDKYYFRVLPGGKAKSPEETSLGSIIEFHLAKDRKVVAEMQKIE